MPQTPTPDAPSERRRGVLPVILIAGITYVVFVYPEERDAVLSWLWWLVVEAVIWATAVPSLYYAVYFALSYVATLCIRPNSTRTHWSTIAFGQGCASAALLLCAGPLLGRWLEAFEWRFTLPTLVANQSLPAMHGLLDIRMEEQTIGGQVVHVEGSWWLAGAALFG